METLMPDELRQLIRSVFPPLPGDRKLAVLIDVPSRLEDDRPEWAARRLLAYEWSRVLQHDPRPLEAADLIAYEAVACDNADLPANGSVIEGPPPMLAAQLPPGVPFSSLFADYQLFLAPTQFSATAPLKNGASKYGFRAATMPGFSPEMIPALRIDYDLVNRRCVGLKERLDAAESARVLFQSKGRSYEMLFDLRYRTAHVSSGRFPQPGTAGNLPSGETYIVPYEGERGEASRTEGLLPVQLGEETVVYEIKNNRAIAVRSSGRQSDAEAERLQREPAYGNLAELGFGVLADFGIQPIGRLLLDEKLGFHVAFGRSDHFGGAVGPKDFSSPQAAVHLDRIYLPQIQPVVCVAFIDLIEGGRPQRLMENGAYTVSI